MASWNLATYLPPYVEECFQLAMIMFIQRPLVEQRKLMQSGMAAPAIVSRVAVAAAASVTTPCCC
jgi:hypothetical protein